MLFSPNERETPATELTTSCDYALPCSFISHLRDTQVPKEGLPPSASSVSMTISTVPFSTPASGTLNTKARVIASKWQNNLRKQCSKHN